MSDPSHFSRMFHMTSFWKAWWCVMIPALLAIGTVKVEMYYTPVETQQEESVEPPVSYGNIRYIA